MWDRIEHQLALLELVSTGQLRLRRNQAAAWNWLAELPWTRRTGRRNEIALEPTRAAEAGRLLDQVWSGWPDALAALKDAGLPVSEHGWQQLRNLARRHDAGNLPPRLNRRTALARVGEHSKTGLSHAIERHLTGTHLTRDGIVRLRPSAGLQLHQMNRQLDARIMASLLGEVILTERAMLEGTTFGGTLPGLLLTVENLGSYLDISVPDDCLVAHVPGWDTRTIRLIFERLPAVPVLHFGDLDPNGVRIVRHLKIMRPDMQWLVPAFWSEYMSSNGLKAVWPADLNLEGTPDLVQALARANIWLEQEAITLDPRLISALEALKPQKHC